MEDIANKICYDFDKKYDVKNQSETFESSQCFSTEPPNNGSADKLEKY